VHPEGDVEAWASNKAPYGLRDVLIKQMGAPEGRVKVHVMPVGGDFGAKSSIIDVPLCYLISQRTRRPVKFVHTYTEELIAGPRRHPAAITVRTGVTNDGTLCAMSVRAVFSGGAYAAFKANPQVTVLGVRMAGSCYRIPAVKVEDYCVYSNQVSGTQTRTPGGPQIVFAVESHLDLIVGSIAANGGRSCINASGVWVPRNGETIARGIAKRLAAIEPLPLDHPEAALSAFTRPAFAKQISDTIDSQLRQAGAVDLTAEYRSGDRLVEIDGCTFLRPTLVWCEDPDHPLANTEFLFPFASVVETPQDTVLRRIGPTLVLSAVTHDNAFRQQLLAAPGVDRLNCGAIPTQKISWDQPHEGNLFEHLYRQRAFQAA